MTATSFRVMLYSTSDVFRCELSAACGGLTELTMMFRVPSSWIIRNSSAEAPSLMDNMQMTAATPKMMPSEVSNDRSLCRRRL